MSNQSRVVKVLAALLFSMTAGAIVLMALGNHPPSSGPFCLSSYYNLNAIEDVISSHAAQWPERWNRLEIHYSSSKAGNIKQLAALNGLAQAEQLNCHFVICNGLGGNDGLIQSTEKWQRQWSSIPDSTWYGSGQTIRICIVSDGKKTHPTDSQIKRTEALVEALLRKFHVLPDSIYYPGNWN